MTQKIKPKSNHKFIFGRVGNIDYIYLIQKSRCFLNEVGRLLPLFEIIGFGQDKSFQKLADMNFRCI